MGVIQQSVNNMIGATTQAVGIGKAIGAMNKQAEAEQAKAAEAAKANMLETNKAKTEHMNEVDKIQKDYAKESQDLASTANELKKAKEEFTAASAEFNDAFTRGTESDPWFPPRKPATEQELDDLAGKASIAKDQLNNHQNLHRAQKSAFKKRQAELQERLDLVNQKGALYGIAPSTLKGGKK